MRVELKLLTTVLFLDSSLPIEAATTVVVYSASYLSQLNPPPRDTKGTFCSVSTLSWPVVSRFTGRPEERRDWNVVVLLNSSSRSTCSVVVVDSKITFTRARRGVRRRDSRVLLATGCDDQLLACQHRALLVSLIVELIQCCRSCALRGFRATAAA